MVVAVTGGRLDLGPWERIFYGEFDGRRRKRVLVKIIGESDVRVAHAGASSPPSTVLPLRDQRCPAPRWTAPPTTFRAGPARLPPRSMPTSNTRPTY